MVENKKKILRQFRKGPSIESDQIKEGVGRRNENERQWSTPPLTYCSQFIIILGKPISAITITKSQLH
jgi:hypothetical protein